MQENRSHDQNQNHNGRIPLTDRQRACRAAGVILPLCVLAAALALCVIALANDLYAFVKPDTAWTLTLDAPQPAAVTAKQLQQNGILQNPHVFLLYARIKGKQDALERWTGEATLRADMSYRTLLQILTKQR